MVALILGIDWQPVLDEDNPRDDEIGYASLRLGIDRILSRIAESPAGWYAIWLDDEVLTVEYDLFRKTFENLSGDPEIRVVSCQKQQWHNDVHTGSNKEGAARWENRHQHQYGYSLFKGCIDSGFDRCLVVTPDGANHLLTFGFLYPGSTYEWLAFHELEQAARYFYTMVHTYTDDIGWFLGSDIENVLSNPSEKVWDLSV